MSTNGMMVEVEVFRQMVLCRAGIISTNGMMVEVEVCLQMV